MTDLPAPLTPADCDLRGFASWMPLLGQRLFSSSWYRAARKDGRGGIAAIKLWWEAMLQCPAGSLPNDEADLCMLADFGEDMRAWQRHRAVAMHGFILCSDNRWYHPVVCEKAIEAFERRQKTQHTREATAQRVRRHRAAHNGQEPPPSNGHETRSETHNETPIVTESVTRYNKPDTPIGNALPLSRERKGKERKGKKEGSAHALPTRARATPPENGDLVAKKGKHPLPTDWEPSTKSLLLASSLGFDEAELARLADQMRTWAWAKGYQLADWDWRFNAWLNEAAHREKTRQTPEPKSVHQQIREAGNLPTFLGPMPDDDNQGIRLTAIAGGKS